MATKVPSLKSVAKKKFEIVKKDVFAYIWVVFIAVLVVMTIWFKLYVKELMVISLLFLIFWYFEDIVFGVTGNTVTTWLSRGQKVPAWKRFPLFFLVIVFLYFAYAGVQILLNWLLPAESVNVVVVCLWLGFLYMTWVYNFAQR